ncbi:MAG: hypothetical protein ABJK59_15470 [Erythrobacter sp.]|uniref:hypothetical protein n=1 Tax=Erythrobacter sp. TaxID=1042 RepID=UPI003299EE17
MINAKASSDTLIRRLAAHAQRLSLQYTQERRLDRQTSAIDWHSAQSLWPNFTEG